MPRIITNRSRHPFTEKPPIGTGIDWGHPLSQGLVGCWLFNEGGGSAYNLCSNKPVTMNDFVYTAEGVITNGSSGYNNINAGDISKADSASGTFLLSHTQYSIANGVSIAAKSTNIYNDVNGFGMYYYAGNLQVEVVNGGYSAANIAALPINARRTSGMVWSGSSIRAYQNGVGGTALSNTRFPTSAGVPVIIGNGGTATGYIHTGPIHWCLLYDRALNADEIKALNENPYQMLLGNTVPDAIIEAPIKKFRGGRR